MTATPIGQLGRQLSSQSIPGVVAAVRQYRIRLRRGQIFLRYQRFVRRVLGAPEAEQRALQTRSLAELSAVLERSAFQRERLRAAGLAPGDLRSLTDLAAIPPVHKADLLDAGLEALATVPPNSRGVLEKATSGSTSQPFRFLLDPHSTDRGNAVRASIYRAMGVSSGPAVELFDSPLDGPNARGRRGHGTPGFDRRVVGYRLPVGEQADLVSRLAPRVLYGNRSHLVLIAEELQRRGTRLPSLRLVVSSSETLSEADRRLIRDALGAPVHDVYGLAEVQAVGWEPVPSSGYRVVAPRVIVEVLRDGEPVAPGETGEVVLTSIDNHVMPFLRYATGDLARLPDRSRPAEAGTTTLWLERIEGRQVDCLQRSDGGLVSAWQASTSTFWGRPHVAEACRQWQIDQGVDLGIVVSVVTGTTEAVPEPVQAEIEAFLREAVGEVTVIVRTVPAVELEPNGKFRAVRSVAAGKS
jgi:phenylacetate-CoA ligase